MYVSIYTVNKQKIPSKKAYALSEWPCNKTSPQNKNASGQKSLGQFFWTRHLQFMSVETMFTQTAWQCSAWGASKGNTTWQQKTHQNSTIAPLCMEVSWQWSRATKNPNFLRICKGTQNKKTAMGVCFPTRRALAFIGFLQKSTSSRWFLRS